MILTIIYFIFILGITVFIHELGHFLFAKKFGVYVYEFSIGMGPRLFKFNRKNDETDYCIRLFPIGGYVQMAGEEVEVDEKIPVEKRLQSKNMATPPNQPNAPNDQNPIYPFGASNDFVEDLVDELT